MTINRFTDKAGRANRALGHGNRSPTCRSVWKRNGTDTTIGILTLLLDLVALIYLPGPHILAHYNDPTFGAWPR
jgi:hypothetical protein